MSMRNVRAGHARCRSCGHGEGGVDQRDWAPDFLAAFETTGLVTRRAGVRTSAGRRCTSAARPTSDFAAAWEELEEMIVERMEGEALRRAVDGVKRETYDKDGNLIRDETVYSDTLLIFLLKAAGRRPTART
jgi:hypothetical protein